MLVWQLLCVVAEGHACSWFVAEGSDQQQALAAAGAARVLSARQAAWVGPRGAQVPWKPAPVTRSVADLSAPATPATKRSCAWFFLSLVGHSTDWTPRRFTHSITSRNPTRRSCAVCITPWSSWLLGIEQASAPSSYPAILSRNTTSNHPTAHHLPAPYAY